MRLQRDTRASPATARELLHRARRISPWPGIVATTGTMLAAVGFVAVAPWGPWNALVVVVAVCSCAALFCSWSGPLWHRRRWLLEIAERACYGYLAFRPSRLNALERRALLAPPDVDELLELTLRLEGTAPFLLRPGERDWLRATTALLIQCEQGGPL